MKIILTKTQVHVAKSLGVSLELYAKTLAEYYTSKREDTKRQRLLAWYWKKKGKR